MMPISLLLHQRKYKAEKSTCKSSFNTASFITRYKDADIANIASTIEMSNT